MSKAEGENPAVTPPGDMPLKLMVVVGSTDEEKNAASWLASEAAALFMKAAPNTEIATFELPKLRVHACSGCYGGGRVCMMPCDRNDIESDIYRPDDGMIPLYEKMQEADMLVLAVDARWGGVNHYMQKFLERLNPFVNEAAHGRELLVNKVGGVIIVGEGASGVAGKVLATLNAVGYALPRYALTPWHIPHAATREQVKSAFDKSKAVHDDLELMVESMVKLTKHLRGQ